MSQDETGEEKVETTTPPAPEETNNQEDNASDGDDTPKDSASESESNEIDYKAELEAAQTRLSQAEYTIEKIKKEKKETTSTSDVKVEYQPEPTRDDLSAQLRAEQQAELDKFKKELTQDILAAELEALSTNPDEAALIRFHYENSIKQSGYSRASIRADLESAKLLANKKRLIRENAELKEALKAKNSVGKAAGGSNQDQQVIEDEPNLTPAEKALMQRHADKAGLSLKEYLRRNKKKLTNK